MPVQVFRLRGVPEDEADEIRALLEQNKVEFYETQDRGWGVSMPAIWIQDVSQSEPVKALIEGYQVERAERSRALYEQQRLAGDHPTLWRTFKAHPFRFLIYCVIIAVVVFFSTRPFLL